MRYRFYREHKYVCAAINDVERMMATTDFTCKQQTYLVKQAFDDLRAMLKSHAEYEHTRLHSLLKARGSLIYERAELEHDRLEDALVELGANLDCLIKSDVREEQIEQGYQLYLKFRKFAGENLLHLHEEETVILPELQRLYSDEELSKVEFESYNQMTPEDLAHMMRVLFSHMNPDDRQSFLSDIKACDEKKFYLATNI